MPNVTGVTVISTESLDALTRECDELREQVERLKGVRTDLNLVIDKLNADVEFWQKRAEIEGEATMNAVVAAEELRAEVEKIERKMTAHRETAVAAIAGSDKQIHDLQAEVEWLQRLRDAARMVIGPLSGKPDLLDATNDVVRLVERLRQLDAIVREHIEHRELAYHLREWLLDRSSC